MRDAWIKGLLTERVEIVLPELTIRGESVGEMKGSGRVSWTPSSGIVLNATTEGGTLPFEMFVGSMLEPGSLVPDTDFVSIEGKTQDQKIFTCKQAYVSGFQSHTDSKFVIWDLPLRRIALEKADKWDGGVYSIDALMGPSPTNWPSMSTERVDNEYFLDSRTFQDWMLAEGEFGKLAARRVSDDWFEMKVYPASEKHDVNSLLKAARDSFSMLIGRGCETRGCMAMSDSVRREILYSPPKRKSYERLSSPLGWTSILLMQWSSQLISKAMDFFLTPIGKKTAEYVHLFHDTAGNNWATKTAIASICVEGLTKLVNSVTPVSAGASADAAPKEFTDWLNQNPLALSPRFKDRLSGFINSLANPRPQDILHKWREHGVLGIGREDIKSWSTLRNGVAHANITIPDQPAELQIQSHQYDCVVTLMFKMVLQLMGYEGMYVNAGLHGERDEVFPLYKG